MVEKVSAGVITFEPFFNSNDWTAKRFADDPLFTISPNSLLKSFATFFSSSFTLEPAIKANLFSFRTFKTAFISSSE